MDIASTDRPTVPLRKPFVLVVDDDADFRESLVEALRDHGYPVQSAPDGEAALRAIRAGAVPGLLLLDLWMPYMDGWQLRQAILDSPQSEIPVIVMTAVGPQDRELLGVQHVLAKPFSIDELLAAVHAHFGRA